jgi:predicted membrane protein
MVTTRNKNKAVYFFFGFEIVNKIGQKMILKLLITVLYRQYTQMDKGGEIYTNGGFSICSLGMGLNKKKKRICRISKTVGIIKTRSLSLSIISFFAVFIDCLYFAGLTKGRICFFPKKFINSILRIAMC